MPRPPLKCLNCREKAVYPRTLPSYVREMGHEGRSYTIEVHDFPVLECRNCGTTLLDDEATERLSDALCLRLGLLAPSEIRKRREELGLSRERLASLLGVPETSLSRWENGGQIQQRGQDLLLRLYFDLPAVRSWLAEAADPPTVGTTCGNLPEDPFPLKTAATGR